MFITTFYHVTCDIWLEFVYTKVISVVDTGKDALFVRTFPIT